MQGIKWNFYCFTYALQQEMDAGLRYKLNIQIYCYVVIAISWKYLKTWLTFLGNDNDSGLKKDELGSLDTIREK